MGGGGGDDHCHLPDRFGLSIYTQREEDGKEEEEEEEEKELKNEWQQ